ncbi:MAG TPA: hypothetical protein VGJ00_03525 [Rhabdochlamydiaceae bacterium]|jgi:hypothetical protein
MLKVFSKLVVLACMASFALSASENRGVLTRCQDSCEESSIKNDASQQDSLSTDPSAGTCKKKKKTYN